ncbi:hypothetical protein [Lysobacter hankyongensis]|uniref:Uncharacterized protein n=1 Tax=Lysobacter hankyongensis TaxID=1176535 RepID=A0ABP9BR78_9GAMM
MTASAVDRSVNRPSPRLRRRRRIAAALLSAALSIGGGAHAAPPGNAPSVAARSAIAQEREILDGVVAASLVGALSEELGGRAVKIRLDRVEVQTTSLRDRLVSGQGTLQIENASDWIGFRFSTLYDAILESAGYPELSIGMSGAEGRAVPNDAALIRELDDRVVGMLGEEFGTQRVRLQLDRISTVETGVRYLRIDANGIADFGLDGTAPTRVEALYDRQDNAWLRVAYVLEGTPPVVTPAPTGEG